MALKTKDCDENRIQSLEDDIRLEDDEMIKVKLIMLSLLSLLQELSRGNHTEHAVSLNVTIGAIKEKTIILFRLTT